jgi:aconitate hydratase
MIKISHNGVYLYNNRALIPDIDLNEACFKDEAVRQGQPVPGSDFRLDRESARKATITAGILDAHDSSKDPNKRKIKFDSLVSHDITYVGIVQTARASGLERFPVPYVLTNCHNSLCAVGGTINEDDHRFGLSAAKKYGGIYVPAHLAVIHSYERETMAACGRMILGSDSHTRYGALGTLAIGEGGPEIVKQLLENTYDIDDPEVVLIYLEGETQPGVGPHDVALAMIGALFPDGFAKNKILEFAGPGIAGLSIDFRNGIDVMTTETTCLSSIWETDDKVREFMEIHWRPEDYVELKAGPVAYYDSLVRIDLSKIEPMIALPFHPANVYTIKDVIANPHDIFATVEAEARRQFDPKLKFDLQSKIIDGKIMVDQGIIAGCAGGTYENICAASRILSDRSTGVDAFSLSVYPQSQPVNLELTRNGVAADLMSIGATMRTAFCGPCFGAGDVPSHGAFSIRHTTRNFPNREGSNPQQGQIVGVALMDARSIAATAANKGELTPATECGFPEGNYPTYHYDAGVYQKRVYNGFNKPQPEEKLVYGPNIADWPTMHPLSENILLQLASVIQDPVTSTDELIPSGETSSYRSNPLRLAEFTLGRRDPNYVPAAKATAALEQERLAALAADQTSAATALPVKALEALTVVLGDKAKAQELLSETAIGSVIFARKPGDGSAREQAASSQRVLGGMANIAYEYATQRYRSNCINWGMIPFTIDANTEFNWSVGSFIFVPNVRQRIAAGEREFPASVITDGQVHEIVLKLHALTSQERSIILNGSLINDYAQRAKNKQES